jgi:hypothetical protein
MPEWFVHQRNADPIGPVSTELLARGVQAGKVPLDAYVAVRGGGWVPLSSVPEIAAAIAAPPAPIDPPRTIPPAPPPTTTLPPAADASAKPPEKKPDPPLPYRRAIPFVVFVAFVLATLVAFALAPKASSAPDVEPTSPPRTATHAARTTTLHVGLTLVGLSKFELGPGTYAADVIVSVRCEAAPCNPDLDVTNGRITSKEKLVDEELHKVFKLKTELAGLVDLSEFPFDEHVLPLELEDKSDPTGVTFVLDEGTTSIAPDVKLAGWELTRWGAAVEDEDVGGGVTVSQIRFGLAITRPRVAGFFKSLMPVFFMVFVALFSLLLKPKSAPGRLATATAGLMSVVMFHVSATSALPPLGYLTRMDKFMIATYAIYVVNVALTVGMVRADEKKRERAADAAYLVAAGMVPGVALLSWALVFLRVV